MEHEIIVEKHFSNKTYNVSLVAWEKNGSGVIFPKEFNVSNYALSQKYSLIGLQAGLSYRFGY